MITWKNKSTWPWHSGFAVFVCSNSMIYEFTTLEIIFERIPSAENELKWCTSHENVTIKFHFFSREGGNGCVIFKSKQHQYKPPKFVTLLRILCPSTPLIPALGRQRQENGLPGSMLAWPTERLPGQPGLHRETLS